jgi:hypothetical protein
LVREIPLLYETPAIADFHARFAGLTAVNMKMVAGFEVLTAVAMKSTIFWDITPCSPLSKTPSKGPRFWRKWFLFLHRQ